MTIIETKRQFDVASVYEFWNTEMTEAERIEFVTNVTNEEIKELESGGSYEEWTDKDFPPDWLPAVFGSDDEGIGHVLERRKELYYYTYDQDYFTIWEVKI